MTRYQPRDYVTNPAFFGRGNVTWQWPPTGTPGRLRGAVVQHYMAVHLQELLHRRRVSNNEFYRRAGRTSPRKKPLQGLGPFTLDDDIANIHAVPDGSPPSRFLHDRVVDVSALLAPSLWHAGSWAGALAMRTDDEELLARQTLATLAGVRVSTQPYAPEPAFAPRARHLAQASALALAARTAVASTTVAPSDEPLIAVTIADDRADLLSRDGLPAITGYWSPDEGGFLGAVALPDDWDRRVDQPGWSVLDDVFVVDVLDSDSQGRPERVLAIALWTWAWPQDSDVDPVTDNDWIIDSRPATVTWTGQQATVRLEPSPTALWCKPGPYDTDEVRHLVP